MGFKQGFYRVYRGFKGLILKTSTQKYMGWEMGIMDDCVMPEMLRV